MPLVRMHMASPLSESRATSQCMLLPHHWVSQGLEVDYRVSDTDDVANAGSWRTKEQGERAFLAANPESTIIRPSIVFGPGDSFFNVSTHAAIFISACCHMC